MGRRRSGRGARGRVVKGSSARTQTPREENPLREDHTSARRAAPVALVVNATTTALTTAARLADDTKATTTPRAAALITESLTAIGDSDAARAQRTRVLRDDGVRHLPNNLPRQLTIVASLAAAEGGDAAGVGWHAVRRWFDVAAGRGTCTDKSNMPSRYTFPLETCFDWLKPLFRHFF